MSRAQIEQSFLTCQVAHDTGACVSPYLATLALRQTAPDAEAFVIVERIVQAVFSHLAAFADRSSSIDLMVRHTMRWEEQFCVFVATGCVMSPFGQIEGAFGNAQVMQKHCPGISCSAMPACVIVRNGETGFACLRDPFRCCSLCGGEHSGDHFADAFTACECFVCDFGDALMRFVGCHCQKSSSGSALLVVERDCRPAGWERATRSIWTVANMSETAM